MESPGQRPNNGPRVRLPFLKPHGKRPPSPAPPSWRIRAIGNAFSCQGWRFVAKPVIITPMQQPGVVGGRAEIVHTLSLEDRLRGAAINHKTEAAKFHGGKILRLFETSVVII